MSADPRVKVCGLTRPDEAAACAALGAWAIGVVFAPESRRRVDVPTARRVLDALPPGVARVGVFVGASPGELAAVAGACGLTHVQVDEGTDPEAARAATGVQVIVGVAVDGPQAVARARGSAADLVLLDASAPGRHGGTGARFDWAILDGHPLGRPFALAGGLTPENVADGVALLGPDVVDVSSGVESAPGRKDPERVARFMAAVADGAARRAGRGAGVRTGEGRAR
jgi:phosphoribosylanthranilate isomerase